MAGGVRPSAGTPNPSAYTGPRPLIYMEFNNLVGPGPNGGAQSGHEAHDGLTYVHALADVTPGTAAVYSPFGLTDTRRLSQVNRRGFFKLPASAIRTERSA